MLPGAEGVAPSLDGKLIPQVPEKGAFPTPTVISVWNGLHGRMVPLQDPQGTPLQPGGNDVVAVLVDVRLEDQRLASDALERVPTTLIKGAHVLNDNRGRTQTHPPVVARHCHAR
jgi:hypothetical protein